MTGWEIFMVGVGLSMDAFAVAVTIGMGKDHLKWSQAFLVAGFFGFFQGLMPLLGWLGGYQFRDVISAYDHWVVLILLLLIGGKMIHGAFQPEKPKTCAVSHLPTLCMLSVATSIDALAIGVSFAFLDVNIILACLIIALTTFCISFGGVWIGRRSGALLGNRAEIVGGIVLIAIGIKIFLGI